MTVVWSRRAIDNLIALRDYIAEDNPRSAGSVARQILDAVELLVRNHTSADPVESRELVN
jgi:plasmid stabilization system protein ParE